MEPARPLRIGIDARAATEVLAGRGRLVRELLRALARRPDPHQYVCYSRERWEQPLDERFTWALNDGGDPIWHIRATAVAAHDCDVLLCTNSYLTVGLSRIPAVAIVYDLLALDRATSPNRRSAVIEQLTIGPAVRHAAGLVCISQATADALIGRYPGAADRVTVALLGGTLPADPAAADELDELPEPGFVLAVGTLEPRKNLPRLVAAYARLPEALQRAHPLVVVGATGWRTGETVAALESLGDRCIRLGRVSDAALDELYRRCAVFCYPSLGEGFGLPVLEAMALGAPVLTSDVSSLPEVGGDAVAYADPLSVDAITAALRGLLQDPVRRELLATRGPERAKLFSWDEFAARTLAVVEHAAAA